MCGVVFKGIEYCLKSNFTGVTNFTGQAVAVLCTKTQEFSLKAPHGVNDNEGNLERGWNDPPVFLHSPNNPNAGDSSAVSASTKRTLLNKRVAHSGLYGNTPTNPVNATPPANQINSEAILPPLVCSDVSQSDDVAGQLPNTAAPDSSSPPAGVVLFPPTTFTELPKYPAPIIVPTMNPVEKDPALPSPTATNPITNAQVNVEDAENGLGLPNFDNDEQMFHYVLAKLQKTLIDVQGTLQAKVTEDVKRKLEILSSMWRSGSISYPVKSSMARLVTALHQRKCDEAHQIHMALMMDSVSEVGQWMVGVKRLIQEARTTQVPTAAPQITTQAPVDLVQTTTNQTEPVTLLCPMTLTDTPAELTNSGADNVVIPPVIGQTNSELSKQVDNVLVNEERENGKEESDAQTDDHQSQ